MLQTTSFEIVGVVAEDPTPIVGFNEEPKGYEIPVTVSGKNKVAELKISCFVKVQFELVKELKRGDKIYAKGYISGSKHKGFYNASFYAQVLTYIE